MSEEDARPTLQNKDAEVFNFRALRGPSFVDGHAEASERAQTRAFLANYRTPSHDDVEDPLAKLKAYLCSSGQWGASRFSDGTYPTVYMGESEETCMEEVLHALGKALGETEAPVTKNHNYLVALFKLNGLTTDVREGFPQLHQDRWEPAQVFGRERWIAGDQGITFSSVRRSGGVNTAVFQNSLVTLGLKIRSLTFQWDGKRFREL